MSEDVSQTDAALFPGISGGALAESPGRIVGITTAVAGSGLGPAVPVNASSGRIIAALLKDGRVRRAYPGPVNTPVQLQPSAVVRTGYREGLLVVEVLPGSPAERSGLRAGDELVPNVGKTGRFQCGKSAKLLSSELTGIPLELAMMRDGTEGQGPAVPEEMTEK